MKEILVEANCHNRKYENRYRFTLAHEIGHLVLHKKLFQGVEVRSITDWKRFVSGFPVKKRALFEFQAYDFAGLVLVPGHLLKKVFHEKETYVQGRLRKEGLDPRRFQDQLLDYIIEKVAGRFAVSTQVVRKRLKKDGIETSIA